MLNFPVSFTPEYTMDLILEALRELVEYELAVVLSMENETTLKVSRARGPLYSRLLDDFRISLTSSPGNLSLILPIIVSRWNPISCIQTLFSTRINRMILNGSEITMGESIIMPMDISTLATTRSMTRNGMKMTNPI